MRSQAQPTETFRVRPGAVTALRLHGGDRLEIVDRHGGQQAELTVLSDGAALGVRPDEPATVLRELARRGESTVPALLAEHGLDPLRAAATRLFGPSSPAGAREVFVADHPCAVVVAAPATPMRVDDRVANPPSDLLLEVRRSSPRPKAEPVLPEPLAEPLLDLRVDAATALDYEVREGQYIQVIDVEGGQCSDFLAFNARRLQDGVEQGLDATTTRSVTGTAYPRPGQASVFFDARAQPLVRVVRDTVGRHDAFGLACTAKYYEDLGYPGHVNCTDNFNARLAKYGIAARAGWPALNFFYNTRFDDDNLFLFDEPWSRPGDHVLLRAMTDLVCASSACPDDIDPANSWVPTDVHIRVYDATRTFSMAIGHRVTPEEPATLTRSTGFAPRTEKLTRRFTDYRGYWLPESFDNHGPRAEYWACRERATVQDLSALRKFEVLGPDAEALLQATLTRDVRRLARGQVGYSALCHDTGGMIDDCTVFRLGEDNFRFVGGDAYDGDWLREQATRLELDRVWVKDSTDQLHNIAVQGPASRDLLAEVVWTPRHEPDLADLAWFRFAIGRVGDQLGPPLLVSRTGYTGELGYELWVHPSDAPALWDAVWAAGAGHGLAPLGLTALDTLRIEAALPFAGHEFCDQTDPFEAGIGFTVPLRSKADDFVGRQALLARGANPRRVLVGLELEGNEPAAHGDSVRVGRHNVGVVTSAARSPVLRANIALCRIAVEHAEPGTAVAVGKLDGLRKRIAAQVVPIPFYDPGKTRPRS